MKLNKGHTKTMTDIPSCMPIPDIQEPAWNNMHLQELIEYIIIGWPSYTNKMRHNMRSYYTFRKELLIIDGEAINVIWVIVPTKLQLWVLDQIHSNDRGTVMTELLAKEFTYLINMNADIENMIKTVPCPEFQQTQTKRQDDF